MNVLEAARASWRELSANRSRSALSFAAVSVGVASLLYTAAQTRGMQLELERNVELMGPGRLTVEKSREYISTGLSPGLTMGDVQAIREELPELYMVDAQSEDWLDLIPASYRPGEKVPHARVRGVSEQWRRRDWVYKLHGRFLNAADLRDDARVCVLLKPGGWHKKPFWANFWTPDEPIGELLKHHDALGTAVRIKDSLFTVVGILDLPPRDLDPRWDSWDNPDALVPITTYRRVVDGSTQESIDEIHLDTGDEKTIARDRRIIEDLMLRRHRGEKDFEVKDMREAIAGEMDQLKKYVTAGLALGIVALLAGGIGIMNVTFATIFSRVKEIGIRRAVGASRGDILSQFLIEAALLGLAGGVAGLLLGLIGVHFLEAWADRKVASIAWYHGVFAIGTGALVSAIFAFYPAYQASALDPVEALRNEG